MNDELKALVVAVTNILNRVTTLLDAYIEEMEEDKQAAEEIRGRPMSTRQRPRHPRAGGLR